MVWNMSMVKELHIELTTRCNLSCPQCTRNLNGGAVNPLLNIVDLDFKVIKEKITPGILQGLNQIFLCGGYGEPILHEDFLEIVRYFRSCNPEIYILIHSNGSSRPNDWWQSLAEILAKRGRVTFGIDGLGATHAIYRRGSDFSKLIDRARSFIEAGGIAQWNFLVFEHNEKEIPDAIALAKKLGFKLFQVRRSGRFFDFSKLDEIESYAIQNKNSETIGALRQPQDPLYKNPSILKINDLKKKYGTFTKFLDQQTISCDSVKGKKVCISAEGQVFPCTFLYENLYDMRFKNANSAPYPPLDENGEPLRDFESLYLKYNSRDLSIVYSSLEEIFTSKFFDEIVESWNKKSISAGKLFQCTYTCGTEYSSCFDQPLNIDLTE